MPCPLISIIITSYNHGAYIGQTLESVLAQSLTSFEVIVVDDGSVDDSWKVIQDFAARDDRIKALAHPDGRNHGLCATLSLALEHCRGEYTAFLESDDLWKPDCLEKRLAASQKSGAGAVFNSVEILRMPDARADGDSIMVGMRHERFSKEAGPVDIRTNLFIENVIPTFSSVMVRKSLLDSIDFASPVPQWVDWWLWIQLSQLSSFVYIPEYMTLWRRHGANYNGRYSFFEYIKLLDVMRNGIKRLLFENKYTLHGLQRIILCAPGICILAIRMLSLLKYGGVKSIYARVSSKLTAQKQARGM